MRILFLSQTHLKKELGGAKVVMELAEEMERLGWRCDLKALPDLVPPGHYRSLHDATVDALRSLLMEHAGSYDVIDYDHAYLPFARSLFDPRPLFVARAVLLAREDLSSLIPRPRTWKGRIHTIFLGRREEAKYQHIVRHAQKCVREADLVNVANHTDEADVVRWGVPRDRIAVLPYGLSRERQLLFDAVPLSTPRAPTVAFVGTFDSRKGAGDFPGLVSAITAQIPQCSFHLFGTYLSELDVLRAFSPRLRGQITVVPRYDPNALPSMLTGCSVGIFPSYMESFGFGLLEMLAAGIPVIAYDVPGPPMMLPAEYLVPRGDQLTMSAKVVGLLKNPDQLALARGWSKNRARDFSWPDIARRTADIYSRRLLGSGHPAA